MRYPCVKDTLQLSPTGTLTVTAAQTVSGRIRQEPFRLEGILIMLNVIATTTASTQLGPDGIAGLVKAIRLRVNDAIGNRLAVNVTGAACLSFIRNNLGTLDRFTNGTYFERGAVGDLTLNSSHKVCYFVPLRHPSVAEPFGNYTSLPLSGAYMKEDPILEIDLRAIADVVAGTTITGATLEAYTILRAVPDTDPYIPSELISTPVNFAATGRQAYELASSGYLTQVLIQGYDNTTYANTVKRQNLFTPVTGQLQVEYGRDILIKASPDVLTALNDYSQDTVALVPLYDNTGAVVYPTDALTKRCLPGEVFLDFLSDFPGADAFSIRSALNLNALGGGDRCKLVFNDWAATAYQGIITHHKFIPKQSGDINALAIAI